MYRRTRTTNTTMRIKTILTAAAVTLLAAVSCEQEVMDVNDRLDNLESRVSKLEQLVSEMNDNISSLQSIVTAMQTGDYITAVTPITASGATVGYTITFAKGDPITIYHGEDGTNGQDGHTPVIGVKQDSDGIWYWTLDGQWLLDANGQKVKAVGIDGKDGADGKDGVTPQLKIENGYWFVSTDNGQTWTQLGKATGEDGKDGVDGIDGKDGDSMFQSVTVTDTEVIFVTADGQTFVIRRAAALSIEFDSADLVVMGTNATRDIHYTITSGVDDITIEALSSADIKVKVVKSDAKTGSLNVKTSATIDEYSKVVVLVNNGSQAIMRTLNFEAEAIEVVENTTKEVTDEGGEVTLEFFSNVPCHAVIPEEAQSWISVAPETKALEKQSINLILQPNDGAARNATVIVKSEDGAITLPYLIEQSAYYSYAGLSENILPEGIDKLSIHNIVFHTLSDVTTNITVPVNIPSDLGGHNIPVYFELQGTTAHYYTKADSYLMTGPSCVSFQGWRELRSVDLSMFCTSRVTSFQLMFESCVKLESVNLSGFDTSNARSFAAMFQLCKSLKSLDISSFSSKSVVGEPQGAECIFNRCYDLVKLDLGSFDLSVCGTSHAMLWLSKFSKNCAIRCNSDTRAKLSDNDSRLGSSADYITWVLPEEEMPELEPIVDPNLYSSTDYSKDKTVRVLHQATKGNGVDIVLLGDAYSDRMIADGTYDADMELAMNAILRDEPYASFQDYINVYAVYAVSDNEIPYDSHTVFDASINHMDPENGVLSYYEEEDVCRYASIAFPDKDLEDIAMILIINQAEGEGNAFTDGIAGYSSWWSDDEYLDYAAHAISVGMINRRDRSQTEVFSNIVSHEFGHVFAKLGDEYILYYGEISDWEKSYIINSYTHLGWWRNIDITSDPQTIKWSRFLNDERYDGTGIGVFEGGYAYASGAWHPSANSIMNVTDNTRKMFNAPSREAIYNRIHKLALGKDWQYDYESFVAYDQKNIDAEKAAFLSPAPALPIVDGSSRRPFLQVERSVTPEGKNKMSVFLR